VKAGAATSNRLPEQEPDRLDPLAPKQFVMEQVPEELFVPAGEEELAPHAPAGLTNPFWSA
jgi:hypothetical protein